MINAVELERTGWFCFAFFTFIEEYVLWLRRTSTKSLQIELVTKYDKKDA